MLNIHISIHIYTYTFRNKIIILIVAAYHGIYYFLLMYVSFEREV